MSTKKIHIIGVFIGIALILGLLSVSAQASIASNFLTFDGPVHNTLPLIFQGGGEDKLEDDSLGAFGNRDNSVDPVTGLPTFSVDDVIMGIITLSDIRASGRLSVPVGANSQVAMLYSLTITAPGLNTNDWLLGPTAAADVWSLQSLLDASIQNPAGLTANSMIVVMSTSTPDTNSNDDPLNWSVAQISNFSNANNWYWEATLGLTPGINSHGSTDYFEFSGTPQLGGGDRGAMTIESQNWAATWLPVDMYDSSLGVHLADATLDKAIVGPAGGDAQARGWIFEDQSSMYVNPVPEPLSILIWSGIAGLGYYYSRRRIRQVIA